ncbi:zinc finger protein 670 isoform X3 [Pleurodeles waltl]|uniref:zinc finger protein 670 isoform X3 n=1 Tax=Pleurodeles waltl TaxID=8319 RepID=UPI00370976A4
MSWQNSDKGPVTFYDVAACFSEEEWKLLHEWQKELYQNVMKEIHQALSALGPLIADSVFSLKAKEKENLPQMSHKAPKRRRVAHSKCDSIGNPSALYGKNIEENLTLKCPKDAEVQQKNDHLHKGFMCSSSDVRLRKEEQSEFIEHCGTKDEECSLSPSPSSVVSVCIKAEEEIDPMRHEDGNQRENISSPTRITFPTTDICIRNKESVVNLSDHHGTNRDKSSINPSPGVPFCVSDDEDIYCVDPPESQRKESISRPTVTDGPVVTAVFSLSLEPEEEAYFQGEIAAGRIATAGDQTINRKKNNHERIEQKASGTEKIKSNLLQNTEKGKHCRSQQWTENYMEFQEEKDVRHKSSLSNLPLPNVYQRQLRVESSEQHKEHEINFSIENRVVGDLDSLQNWKQYPCNDCGEQFTVEEDLRRHQQTHEKNKNMPLRYITSQRGNKQLIYGGYIYNREKEYGSKILWKCSEYHTTKCRARVNTRDDAVVHKTEHNHVPSPGKIIVKQKINEIKQKAQEKEEATSSIITDACSNVPFHIAGELPRPSLLKRRIKKKKVIQDYLPKIPHNLSDFVIPEKFKVTINGDRFLQLECSSENENIVLFATEKNLAYLRASKIWQVDGTFKTCPEPFKQLYTVHGYIKTETFPLVYALLPDTKLNTYNVMFQRIKELTINPPKICIMDFDANAMNAIKSVFPEIQIQGCFYHFMQAMWRSIQRHDLQLKYSTDSLFAHNLKLLCSLAFVPTQDVISTYEELQRTHFYCENQEMLAQMLNYFEDNWVGRFSRTGRRNPDFAIELWNCMQSVQDDTPQMNSKIEEWHNAFSQTISIKHCSLWKCLSTIQKEQSLQESKIEQCLSGEMQATSFKRIKDLRIRLKQAVADYGKLSQIEYLHNIALVIAFQM